MDEITHPTTTEEIDGDPPAALDEVPTTGDGELVVEDLLVEEISIDGMCGVY
ncbi:MAG: mycofactocin precursor MftA [Acidimicrobiia bacterium]|nr:mycofactocin precursor MftA [Acidimicrobiia bacterium]